MRRRLEPLVLYLYFINSMTPSLSWPSSAKIYILAKLLTTWKLGGVFIPLDYHVPREILKHMLFNIAPTLVLAPSTELVFQKIQKCDDFYSTFSMSATDNESLLDLSLPCLPFDLKIPKVHYSLALFITYY